MIAYATGHLPNDLVITIWNSYCAIYLVETIQLKHEHAGLVVLVGQIVDAIFQPLVSFCSDNIDTRIGKRMPWYIIGNILVIPCFFMIFNPPDYVVYDTEGNSDPMFLYFIILPSLMNVG